MIFHLFNPFRAGTVLIRQTYKDSPHTERIKKIKTKIKIKTNQKIDIGTCKNQCQANYPILAYFVITDFIPDIFSNLCLIPCNFSSAPSVSILLIARIAGLLIRSGL